LTGYTPFVKDGMLSTLVLAGPLPASIVIPDHFATLPPDYLAASSHDGTDHLFFYTSTIDPDLLALSWTSRGTVTLGELVTTIFSPSVVPNYTGDIFVLTGSDDAIFCAKGFQGIETISSMVGDCGEGSSSKVAEVQTQYPNAKSFGYFQPNQTGHGTVLQYGAQVQFQEAHGWLRRLGY
jgi:hypothetical protein